MCPMTHETSLAGVIPCPHMALVPGRAARVCPPRKLNLILDLQFAAASAGLRPGCSCRLIEGALAHPRLIPAPLPDSTPTQACAARGAWHPYTDWSLGAAAEPVEGVQDAHIDSSHFRRAHSCCLRPPTATRVISPSSLMSRVASGVRWWGW